MGPKELECIADILGMGFRKGSFSEMKAAAFGMKRRWG